MAAACWLHAIDFWKACEANTSYMLKIRLTCAPGLLAGGSGSCFRTTNCSFFRTATGSTPDYLQNCPDICNVTCLIPVMRYVTDALQCCVSTGRGGAGCDRANSWAACYGVFQTSQLHLTAAQHYRDHSSLHSSLILATIDSLNTHQNMHPPAWQRLRTIQKGCAKYPTGPTRRTKHIPCYAAIN